MFLSAIKNFCLSPNPLGSSVTYEPVSLSGSCVVMTIEQLVQVESYMVLVFKGSWS